MSDQLKKYLQQSKDQLNQAEPPADLFDQIYAEYNQTAKPISLKLVLRKVSMWAAAAVFLIICGTLLWMQPTKSNLETASVQTAQQHSEAPVIANNTHEEYSSSSLNHSQSVLPTLKNNNLAKHKLPAPDKKINTNEYPKNQDNLVTTIPADVVVANTEESSNISLPKQEDVADVTMLPVENRSVELEPANEIKSPISSSSNQALTQYSTNEQQLDHKIRKGLFGLLSKKTQQWSNKKIQIQEKEINDNSYLALQIKSGDFEFNKSLRISGPRHE